MTPAVDPPGEPPPSEAATGDGPAATERVLAGYCHDLNGQLANALGWLSLLGPDADTGGPLRHLRESLDRIEELVRELRWLVRDPEPVPAPTSLADLLRAFEGALVQHPRFGRVAVTRRGPADLPAVRTDFASAVRVLLLAADAMVGGDPVQSVTLVVDERASTVRIAFEASDGPGAGDGDALRREAAVAGLDLGTDADGHPRWVELPRLG